MHYLDGKPYVYRVYHAMMIANIVLFIGLTWALGGLALGLHYLSPRFGFSPLVLLVGVLVAFLGNQYGIYVEPVDGFTLFIGSNLLVPVLLMIVLVVYIANGAVPARMSIYGILAMNLFVLIIQTIYREIISLPGGGSLSAVGVDVLFPVPLLRTTIASMGAFLADMFVIAVFYQGMKNNFEKVPEWVAVGLALLASLWTDAILFRFISDLGTNYFGELLPGDVLGKTVSAFILWPVAAYYLSRIAPRMPGHISAANRPTFDVLFGSLDEIRTTLNRTQAELQQSEAKRREEAEYFKQISDNITEALWLASPGQHHSYYVNPAYEKIWGRSAASLYADSGSFLKSIHPDDHDRILAGLSRQAEGNYDVEFRVIRPDGSVRWVRDRAFPIHDDDGVVYRIAGITEDITERKQMEQRNLELTFEREKVKLLRDFISETSHDLKNPLTSINLKLRTLARTDDPEKRQRLIQDLEHLSMRMNRLIDDLLALARLENLGELQILRLNLYTMLKDICASVGAIAEEKALNLVCDAPDTEVALRGDEQGLVRAVHNLVENAINYTPDGGQVRVEAATKNSELVIRVIDNGIGIPDDSKEAVFKRFFRARNARAVDDNGTGLGLAIVRKTIERHQGRIDLESAEGVGTTFTLTLPTLE